MARPSRLCSDPRSFRAHSALSSLFSIPVPAHHRYLSNPPSSRLRSASSTTTTAHERWQPQSAALPRSSKQNSADYERPSRDKFYQYVTSRHRRVVKELQRDGRDIIPGDLQGTLEAHRNTNRTAVIRKIRVDDPDRKLKTGTYRPDIEYVGSQEHGGKEDMRDDGSRGRKKVAVGQKDKAAIQDGRTIEQKDADPWQLMENYAGWKHGAVVPWILPTETVGGDALARLSSEIEAFQRWTTPNGIQKSDRSTVAQDTMKHINEYMPDNKVYVRNLESNILASSTSPVRLLMHIPEIHHMEYRGPSPFNEKGRRKTWYLLKEAAGKLKARGVFSGIDVLRDDPHHSRVVARHKEKDLNIEIEAETPYTASSEEYALSYLSEFPALRSIFFVVQRMIMTHDLSRDLSGQITPNAMFLLVVAALKLQAGIRPADAAGDGFLELLRFYAHLDAHRHGISIEPAGLFDLRSRHARPSLQEKEDIRYDSVLRGRHTINLMRGPDALCLQSPVNSQENVFQALAAWTPLRGIFRDALARVEMAMRVYDADPEPGRWRNERWSLLVMAMGGREEPFKERLRRVVRWGGN